MSIVTDHACRGQTVVDRILFWSKIEPSTPAFIFWSPAGRRVLSRGDVLDLSSRFAQRLVEHGVKPGDVVCVAVPNSLDRAVVEFGIHLAGAVSMNGQVLRADGEDLIETMIKAKCTSVVLNPDQTPGAWQVCKHAFDQYQLHDKFVEIKSQRIPSLKTAFICRPSESKDGFTESLNEDQLISKNSSPQDTCVIFTTSGSTGYSKLVPQNHEALLTFEYTYCYIQGLQQGTKFFDGSPFGWLGGYPALYLYSGCTHVTLDETHGEIPDKTAFIWKVLSRENIKHALLIPAAMEAIKEYRSASQKHQEQHRLSGIITGGQPVTKENIAVIGELTDSVTVVYGATEFCLATHVRIDLENSGKFHDDMAGYPFPGFKIKIVDKNLKPVPVLSRGEIILQCPTLSTGYIGSEAAFKDFLPDRWFRTGDIGFLRDDGCLFVEGRSSDAIMHGAYILYPTWLEQKVVNCPGVKEVVIVPVPHKVLHHEICACVKLDDTSDAHPTAEDIVNFCQQETVLDKSSSLNVIPKYVVFFTEFPQTITDKLDRRGLAKIAIERLNL